MITEIKESWKMNKRIAAIFNNCHNQILSNRAKNRKKLKKAAAISEYAVLTALIGASLLSSFIYVKRANQGRLMKAAGALGTQFSPSHSSLVRSTQEFSHTRRALQFNGEAKEELLEDEWTKTGYSDNSSGVSLKQEGLWE